MAATRAAHILAQMTPQVDPAAERSSPDASGSGVVAWYAEGFRDGLGDRLLLFDTTGPGLELLRITSDLSSADGFEALLRARAEALRDFRHPAFAPVRAVKWLDEPRPTLALVSEHVAGERLSRVLRLGRARGLRPGPDAVVWMLRRLLPVLAALQERQGIAHGLLTADRIVVRPDASLAIADYVFASAMERLRFTPFELWDRFGIAAGGSGLSRQADVEQVARLAVAMLIERHDVSTPGPVPAPELVAQVRDRLTHPADRRLGDWIARALGVEAPAFYTARQAENALDGMLPDRPGEWATWLLPVPPETRALQSPRPAAAGEIDDGETMGATVVMTRAEIEAMHAAATAAAARATGETAAVLLPLLQPRPRHHRAWRYLAIGLAALAGVEGLVLLTGRWRDGEVVLPVVTAPAVRRPAPLEPVVAPAAVLAPGGTPFATPQPPRPALGLGTGWLTVRSGIPLRIYADGRLLGTGKGGTYRLRGGDHEVLLLNEDAGVRVKRAVRIVPGETATIAGPAGDR